MYPFMLHLSFNCVYFSFVVISLNVPYILCFVGYTLKTLTQSYFFPRYFKAVSLEGSVTIMMVSLLASSVISQLVYTKFHSLPGCIACPSSTAVPFQSRIAISIAASVEPDAAVATVMVTFAIVAMLYGLFVILLSFVPHLDMSDAP